MAATKEYRAFDAAILADRLQGTITAPTSLDILEARPQVVREQEEARIQAPTPKAIEAATRDSLRVMLSSFALAMAFAMGAQRKGSDVPLLVEWHTMLSIRGPRQTQASGGGQRGLTLPGHSASADAAYLSSLAPEADEDAETGVPPPPSEALRSGVLDGTIR